jgi:PHD/YefM family antitoxin component YafN of YafNO toxin-antitoxin module
MTLMSSEVYDALIETLEIVADEPTLSKLRRALQEIEKGKGISWSEAKRRLRLPQ